MPSSMLGGVHCRRSAGRAAGGGAAARGEAAGAAARPAGAPCRACGRSRRCWALRGWRRAKARGEPRRGPTPVLRGTARRVGAAGGSGGRLRAPSPGSGPLQARLARVSLLLHCLRKLWCSARRAHWSSEPPARRMHSGGGVVAALLPSVVLPLAVRWRHGAHLPAGCCPQASLCAVCTAGECGKSWRPVDGVMRDGATMAASGSRVGGQAHIAAGHEHWRHPSAPDGRMEGWMPGVSGRLSACKEREAVPRWRLRGTSAEPAAKASALCSPRAAPPRLWRGAARLEGHIAAVQSQPAPRGSRCAQASAVASRPATSHVCMTWRRRRRRVPNSAAPPPAGSVREWRSA